MLRSNPEVASRACGLVGDPLLRENTTACGRHEAEAAAGAARVPSEFNRQTKEGRPAGVDDVVQLIVAARRAPTAHALRRRLQLQRFIGASCGMLGVGAATSIGLGTVPAAGRLGAVVVGAAACALAAAMGARAGRQRATAALADGRAVAQHQALMRLRPQLEKAERSLASAANPGAERGADDGGTAAMLGTMFAAIDDLEAAGNGAPRRAAEAARWAPWPHFFAGLAGATVGSLGLAPLVRQLGAKAGAACRGEAEAAACALDGAVLGALVPLAYFFCTYALDIDWRGRRLRQQTRHCAPLDSIV